LIPASLKVKGGVEQTSPFFILIIKWEMERLSDKKAKRLILNVSPKATHYNNAQSEKGEGRDEGSGGKKGYDLPTDQAMELEFRLGMEVINGSELREGVNKFSQGMGKHGQF